MYAHGCSYTEIRAITKSTLSDIQHSSGNELHFLLVCLFCWCAGENRSLCLWTQHQSRKITLAYVSECSQSSASVTKRVHLFCKIKQPISCILQRVQRPSAPSLLGLTPSVDWLIRSWRGTFSGLWRSFVCHGSRPLLFRLMLHSKPEKTSSTSQNFRSSSHSKNRDRFFYHSPCIFSFIFYFIFSWKRYFDPNKLN